ncbi:MAG: alpha/beta hydrolase [Bacilli bacterium]|nr:alpha/beta hydrolase [Bacilli bacterium]
MDLSFSLEGKGENIIVLHGWGCNKELFKSIASALSTKYQVYVLDLPGFGKSEEPRIPYTLDDYTKVLKEFINKNHIENPIIIGHSFGGRIGIRYAYENKVKKLILIDSAGIKHHSIIKSFKIYRYKLLKKWYVITKNISKLEELTEKSGSADFKAASNIMKRTLSLIVNTNQLKELSKIECETLILWGVLDKTTPYQDALIMKKRIKNSALISFDESGHFPFIDEEYKFIKVLKSYLQIGDD